MPSLLFSFYLTIFNISQFKKILKTNDAFCVNLTLFCFLSKFGQKNGLAENLASEIKALVPDIEKE